MRSSRKVPGGSGESPDESPDESLAGIAEIAESVCDFTDFTDAEAAS
ncbi:hypothetical protein [Streptomyces sp. NPDC001680]